MLLDHTTRFCLLFFAFQYNNNNKKQQAALIIARSFLFNSRFIQNHKTNQKSVFFKYKINCIIQRSTVAYKWTLYASALPVQLPCNRIPCLAPRSWVWFVCWQRCFCSYSFFSDSIFSNAWLQMSCPAQMRGHFSTAAPTK